MIFKKIEQALQKKCKYLNNMRPYSLKKSFNMINKRKFKKKANKLRKKSCIENDKTMLNLLKTIFNLE
jgi:hypothetical protein